MPRGPVITDEAIRQAAMDMAFAEAEENDRFVDKVVNRLTSVDSCEVMIEPAGWLFRWRVTATLTEAHPRVHTVKRVRVVWGQRRANRLAAEMMEMFCD